MKRLRGLLLLPLLIPVLAGCYNDATGVLDGGIWDRLNEHEERLAALEEWQQRVNDNISALQQLLNTADYITAVTPVEQGGKVIGYTISFRNSDPITIYHGEKGEQGEQGPQGEPGEQGKPGEDGEDGDDAAVPAIGLAKGTDGNWYWTLNGDFILDQDGDPVRANGTPGSEGQPGQPGTSAPVPQLYTGSYLELNLDITADAAGNALVSDAIYLSVDGGATWHRVSGEKGDTGDDGTPGTPGATGATGPKGDSMFEKAPVVDETAGTVGFFLEGNTGDTPDFTLPLYLGMTITFTDETVAMPKPGESLALNLSVTGETATTQLRAIAPDGWEAELTAGTEKGAYVLTLTAPARGLLSLGADCSGRVFVTMNDGHGSSTMAEKEICCVFFTVDTATNIQGGSYSYEGFTLQIGITEGNKPVVLAESAPIGAEGIVHFGNNYLAGMAAGDEVWFCIPGVVKFFHTLTDEDMNTGDITLPDKDKGSTLTTNGTANDWIVALYMGTNKGGFLDKTGTPVSDIPIYFASGNLIAVKTNAAGSPSTEAKFHIASQEETVMEANSRSSGFQVGGSSYADDVYTNYPKGTKWDLFSFGDPTGVKVLEPSSGADGDSGFKEETHISGNPKYDISRAQLGGSWRLPVYNDYDNRNEMQAFYDAYMFDSAMPGYYIEPMAKTWMAANGTTYQGLSYTYTVAAEGDGVEISNTLYFPAAGKFDSNSYSYRGAWGYYWQELADQSGQSIDYSTFIFRTSDLYPYIEVNGYTTSADNINALCCIRPVTE